MDSTSKKEMYSGLHLSTNEIFKKVIISLIAISISILLFIVLPETFNYEARATTSIITLAVLLWAFEPIPLGLTAMIAMVLMLLMNVSEIDVIFSGFSSPAIYLIIAGMMLANAVNETPLARRVTYKLLERWGTTSNGLVGSLLIIIQLQAFFIPATAVRTTLMLPITSMIVKTIDAKPRSNLRKLIGLSVAFGGNISGTGVMTAAVGNILTVELLNRYANVNITYFQWFLYTFPLWLLLIPAIWLLLIKMYPLPKEQQSFPKIKDEMQRKTDELGAIKGDEISCIIILVITVLLWLTEPLHGLHPSVPALIGVSLMALPGIGCAVWEKVVSINYNTVLLVSVTLSTGYVFVDSGTANIISNYLSVPWLLKIMQSPILSIVFIVILTQIFHKLISNVSTAVVTMLPIVINMAINANIDPTTLSFTAGLTCLFGFILVVETMPNLLVHGTGLLKQRDFLKPGIYATIISMILTIIVAMTWWQLIGLV